MPTFSEYVPVVSAAVSDGDPAGVRVVWNPVVEHEQGNSAIGMPELRRRFCLPGTWQFAVNRVKLTGACSLIKSPGPSHLRLLAA